VDGDGQRRRDQPAGQGAEQAAPTERRVQPGQQGPAGPCLDLDTEAVGGDVDHAGGGTEDQQPGTQRRHRAGQPGQHRGGAHPDAGHGADQSGSESGAQRAGELHAGQRTE
jgi:hypothetical protein